MSGSAAIFDVDGTLLDSMPVWHDCGVRYLAGLGIEAEPGLGDKLFTMTAWTSAEYMIKTYGLDKTVEEVSEGMLDDMERYYRTEAEPKPGAYEILDSLYEAEVPMSVATSTDRYCIDAVFDRLDMAKYFEAIVTCAELETTKSEPDVFNEACERMGSEPEDTWVFEDGLFAIDTAKDAGFRTVAVFDEISKESWDDMRELADVSVMSLLDFEDTDEFGVLTGEDREDAPTEEA